MVLGFGIWAQGLEQTMGILCSCRQASARRPRTATTEVLNRAESCRLLLKLLQVGKEHSFHKS